MDAASMTGGACPQQAHKLPSLLKEHWQHAACCKQGEPRGKASSFLTQLPRLPLLHRRAPPRPPLFNCGRVSV